MDRLPSVHAPLIPVVRRAGRYRFRGCIDGIDRGGLCGGDLLRCGRPVDRRPAPIGLVADRARSGRAGDLDVAADGAGRRRRAAPLPRTDRITPRSKPPQPNQERPPLARPLGPASGHAAPVSHADMPGRYCGPSDVLGPDCDGDRVVNAGAGIAEAVASRPKGAGDDVLGCVDGVHGGCLPRLGGFCFWLVGSHGHHAPDNWWDGSGQPMTPQRVAGSP